MTGCKLQEKYYLVLKWSSLIFHLKSRNWNLCFISINDGMLFVTSWTKEYLLMKIFTEDSWERSWDKYYLHDCNTEISILSRFIWPLKAAKFLAHIDSFACSKSVSNLSLPKIMHYIRFKAINDSKKTFYRTDCFL